MKNKSYKSLTHSSSFQLPSDIIGSIVNELPAFITPIALLSVKSLMLKFVLKKKNLVNLEYNF